MWILIAANHHHVRQVVSDNMETQTNKESSSNIIHLVQGLFGHGICFAVGVVFGISDCSNHHQSVPGEVRKVALLIRSILMFMVVAGVTTAAAVITTMQNKAKRKPLKKSLRNQSINDKFHMKRKKSRWKYLFKSTNICIKISTNHREKPNMVK